MALRLPGGVLPLASSFSGFGEAGRLLVDLFDQSGHETQNILALLFADLLHEVPVGHVVADEPDFMSGLR